MAIDTPATIVFIGAGPVGIEAALYARFLGYDVQVLEQGRVGEGLLGVSDDSQPLPVAHCCSPLGLRALMAQDPRWSPPELDTLWTPRELVEHYLAPLTRTDLLDGLVLEQTRVVDVRRTELVADELEGGSDEPTDELEEGWVYEDAPPSLPPLRVTVEPPPGSSLQSPAYYDADVVIDASGITAAGPDYTFLTALRFERCPQTDRPLQAADAAHAGAAARLVLPEPNLYILGSKTRGSLGELTILDGLRQIRDLFALIGGRQALDLYEPISPAQ